MSLAWVIALALSAMAAAAAMTGSDQVIGQVFAGVLLLGLLACLLNEGSK